MLYTDGNRKLGQKKPSMPINTQSITLTGLMGTGKSTIGKLLASKLNLPFYDSDVEIEKKYNSSISKIFSIYGEEFFRVNEKKMISKLLSKPICVIATGGGSIVDDKSHQLIRSHSISIWLYASLETLNKRLIQSKNRPLLNGKDNLKVLKLLSKERNHIYSKSDISIDSGEHSPVKTVEKIISELNLLKK
tara:strand:+ start:533 stop:1105 length:573 start_codon:yes stop_codon:yes gene_type:complete